jgi:hypothetical protein
MKTSSVVVLSALAAHTVSAGWFDQKPKTTVQNTPQQCSPQELKGLDWSDLSAGPVQKSTNYTLQGFTCRESPLQDSIDKRGIARRNPKNCITTDIESDKFSNEISSTKQFSITKLYVSVDKEVNVEFQYSMPDGSTCRQVQLCSGSGTTVINEQCGGAVSVKSRIFKQLSSTVEKCSLNIYKIEFNCGQGTGNTSPAPSVSVNPDSDAPEDIQTSASDSSVPTPSSKPSDDQPASTSASASASTPSSASTDDSADHSSNNTSDDAEHTDENPQKRDEDSTEDQPSQSNAYSAPAISSAPSSAPSSDTSYDLPSSPAAAYSDSPSVSPSVPSFNIPSSSLPSSTMSDSDSGYTSAPSQSTASPYGDDAPAGSSIAPLNQSGSLPIVSVLSIITMTTTSCTQGNVPAPSTSVGSVGCPNILPQCMQTYLNLTKCVNTGDVNCLCPNSDFTKEVTNCIAAWGDQKTDEIPKAIEYLQGLCAPYIKTNPNIIVDVPNYISLPPATGLVTTVSVSSTMVVPNTAVPSKSVIHIQSFVTKLVMTAVTVPAVKIIPSGVSDAVVVPATATIPALAYSGNTYIPYSTGGPRPYNATFFNNTSNPMIPPSLGAADNLSPVRYVVVLVAGLVSFVTFF